MAKQTGKLDFSEITFDDVIGDGLTLTDEGSDKGTENLDEDLDEPTDEDEDEGVDNQEENEEEEDEDESDGSDEDSDSDDSDSSITASIAKSLGYELETDYEDTEEGLLEFTKDVAQNMAEDQIKALFDQFPTVQKHLDFVLAGGDPEKFFETFNPSLDYNRMEIDRDDSRVQKTVLTEFFKKKGHDDEFIKEMIEDYEDTGKLYDKAVVAKKQLGGIQEQDRQRMVEAQKEANARQIKEQRQFWEGVADTLQNGKEFGGIRIPEKEKSKFFDYISAPVNTAGKTKRDEDYEKANLDVKLAIDYLMYKGFKLEDIIQTKARTTQAQSLREKIKETEKRVGGSGRVGKTAKFDVDQLDMKTMFGQA
jgi:hypothetical protein